jgi:tRNA pseudouridine55 synthase
MNGILPLDKPSGITSFGAVSAMRRILSIKKIGHAGTLDPMATGVLPILIGSATRFLDYLPADNKRYTALIKLGFTTDTLDTTGNVISHSTQKIEFPELTKAVDSFRGEIQQIPPMYSAVQKDGVRLYDLARKGVEVDREPRKIKIYKSEILKFNEEQQEFTLDVSCSKGTYIRTLAADIGDFLGSGACLAGLRRTEAAGYKLSQCYTISEIEDYFASGTLEKRLTPVEDALNMYSAVSVSEKQAKRFRNGGELDLTRLKGNYSDGMYRIFDPDDTFLGLGEADALKGIMKVIKVFVI